MISKKSVLHTLSINVLSTLAYNYFEFTKKKTDYVLSIIDTKSDDFFVQLYSLKKNFFNLSVLPVSNIHILKLNEIDYFINKKSFYENNLTILNVLNDRYYKNNTYDTKILSFNVAECIGKIGFEINSVSNKDEICQYSYFNEGLKPSYIKNPSIN